MTDISPLVNELLKSHDAGIVRRRPYSLQTLNGFLKEAYTINARITELSAYLHSIRQPYLSAAQPHRRKQFALDVPTSSIPKHEQEHVHLTNSQRDQIDAEAKRLLRELNATISNLSEAEKIRQSTGTTIALKKRARAGLGALGRWAAGGAASAKSPKEEVEELKANTIKTHRESVIWYLRRRLEECSRLQSSMMEIRITREVEKSKSVPYKSAGLGMADTPFSLYGDLANGQTINRHGSHGLRVAEMDGQDTGPQLSQDQMQLFAKENQDMVRLYESTLDQVRTAERSLIEISDLQTTLANNLAIQSAQIDQLVQDSDLTAENLGKGNKELKQATERTRTARLAFFATVLYCLFLIIWDLIF